jgi:uncharacterized protein YodC (DUF2158 family)
MDQQAAFNKGDAVQLRSGGPQMSVCALSFSLAYCAWSDEHGGQRYGTFDQYMLVGVSRPPTPSGWQPTVIGSRTTP